MPPRSSAISLTSASFGELDEPKQLVLNGSSSLDRGEGPRSNAEHWGGEPSMGVYASPSFAGTAATWAVAVGTALRLVGSGSPPRRSQRARLAHWAPASGSGVEAHVGPGMQDAVRG